MAREEKKLEIYKKGEVKNAGFESPSSHSSKAGRVARNGFFSGVLMLSLSTIAVKIIGLVYKIPMLGLLGSEGMGYFNSAYEIYALLCIISTSGLPVAMSVMISKSEVQSGADSIFKVAMRIFLVLGTLGTALMLVFSYPLARFLGGDKSFYCILAIAPTLFFICIVSAYRGYFQGRSQMMPTALSQVIEALGKLLLGLLFAYVALSAGLEIEKAAACAVLGLLCGSAISALCLMLIKRTARGTPNQIWNRDEGLRISRELLSVALPITLSAGLVSLTKMIDMTMILRRLQSIGYLSSEAFSVYGSYTTLCLPLFSLAPTLASSVSMPILPRLGKAISDRDIQAQTDAVNEGLCLTSLISMPVSAGLALYSKEILTLLFKNQPEAIELCAPLLTVLSFSVGLSCLVTYSNAVLQAYGRPSIPLLSMGVGAIVKIVLAYFLIGNESVNIMGAPISTFFCDLVINLISFACICKCIPKKISVGKTLVLPFAAAVISVGVSKFLYGAITARYGEGNLMTAVGICIAALLYCLLCLVFKIIDPKEIILSRKSDGIKT